MAARNVAELLQAQARRTPDAIAVTFEGRDFSYAALDLAADAVAAAVAARVAGPEPLVGLCIARGFAMVAGLIGILRAGAAYLPLDPGLPQARLEQIVAEAGPALLLAPEALAPLMTGLGVPLLLLEDVDAAPPVARRRSVGPESLAYVLYTSGSTGRPKGVEITHGAVLTLLAACRRAPGMDGSDVVLARARISFDVSVLELFLPLSCGARVVLLSEGASRDPFELARAIEDHGATVVQAPPALWQSLITIGWRGRPTLRAWSGAETLSRALADRLLPLCQEVWNAYGPTETTVVSALHRVRAEAGEVPIGHAIADTTLLVCDAALRPIADGGEGELCIAGAGLARGYRARPDLTAERFVRLPGTGLRVYRTGDRARVDRHGRLLFLGRIDGQVKLRGFRVELGEIEAALARHPAVAACAVRTAPDAIGETAAFAYVVAQRDARAPLPDLGAYLRARLPDYMVPQRIIPLPALPLTPNGKVDREALPLPVGVEPVPSDPAPAGTQERLAAIWQTLLGPQPLAPDDDFFALGGYSLLTVQLLLHIEESFGRRLSMAQLLTCSTLAAMTRLIDEADRAGDRRIVAIQPQGRAVPLYWLDAGPLLMKAFAAIGHDIPVFGVNLAPEDESVLMESGFDVPRLAAAVVAILRDTLPHGPFHLGGWCRWGIVAYEAARQLAAIGRAPSLVLLLDTDLPVATPAWRRLARELRHRRAAPPPPAPRSFGDMVGALAGTYAAAPYGGDVALVQPVRRRAADAAAARWASLVEGRVSRYLTAGDHITMVRPPNGTALGAALRAALCAAGP